MTAPETQPCGRGRCRAEVMWVYSRISNRYIPINADTVEPRAGGAVVLIGSTVFDLEGAVRRIALMFDVNEAIAYATAIHDYTWHLPHPATCIATHPSPAGRR